ncbi:MAG: HD-GYP domain-containing protein, partial [Nitrospirota bacterium]
MNSETDKTVRYLSTLMELSALLNSTLDQKVVRRRAMEAATRLMECEVGSLLLVDEERGDLFFEVALGEKGDQVKEIRLKIGKGIAGWVAEKGEPAIINDVQNDPRFFKKADEKSKFVTRNMICVPVKSKGKVIGVLQAINKLGGLVFTEEDLTAFESLSNQVAIAIENARLYEELHETFISTSTALAEAIEKRDPYTGGHTKRVMVYSIAMGKELGLSDAEIETLKLSAILHDVGKIGIEDKVLRKQGSLDDEEFKQMKMHPLLGGDILVHVRQLRDVIPGTLFHHERPDGRGYPKGLNSNEIPFTAKIIATADTFDAMTTTRPYRKALSFETAFMELKKYSGVQFDSKVVEAFFRAWEKG